MYHINKKGDATKCNAKPGNCPLKTIHAESADKARKSYEKIQEDVLVLKSHKFNEDEYIKVSDTYLSKLSLEEKEALGRYVISEYQNINEKLWVNDASHNDVTLLDSALDKSVPTRGPLWRTITGNSSTSQHYQSLEKGDEITLEGFTSTGETPESFMAVANRTTLYMLETPHEEQVVDGWKVITPKDYTPKNTNIVLKIKTKKAAPVSMLRGRSTEQEWLVPRGKRFKVKQVTENVELSGASSHLRSDTKAKVLELEEI